MMPTPTPTSRTMAGPSSLSEVDPDDLVEHMQRLNVRYKLSDVVLGIVVEFYTVDSNEQYQFHGTTEEQSVLPSMFARVRQEQRPFRIRFEPSTDKTWQIPAVGAIVVWIRIYSPNKEIIVEHVLLIESYNFKDGTQSDFCQKLCEQLGAASSNNKRIRVEEQVRSSSRPQKKARGISEVGQPGTPPTWRNCQNTELLELEVNCETDANDNDTSWAIVRNATLALNIHKGALCHTLSESVDQL